MEPVTLALMLFKAAAAHPEAAASAVGHATRPGVIDVQKMQGSVVDLSKGILACYHRTAHFEQADLVQSPSRARRSTAPSTQLSSGSPIPACRVRAI